MTASKERILKICEYCGKSFYASKSTTRYCSKQCNSYAYKAARREEKVKMAETMSHRKASEKSMSEILVKEYLTVNMWMLLIVKLLSFKRYNYPFYKCRENGRQMQCAYSQPVSDKVVPLLFSLFCKILETNAMHCFSASSVSCVTERLSGCKDTDLYWIRANYYLKKDYSIVAFWITSLTLLRNAFCHHSRV